MSDQEEPRIARIPADIDREDRILAGFTARQLGILGLAGLILAVIWSAGLERIPLPVLVGVSIPIAAASFGIAVGRRDGLSLQAWLVAALRFAASPKAFTGAAAASSPPRWITTATAPEVTLAVPAPLRAPARGITETGVIDLGPDGHAGIAACTTVNFTLRTPSEQNGLVAGFARWLHTLDQPAQILVRAHRVDLAERAAQLHTDAAGLPHPALEAAARAHADYLTALSTSREVLHRSVLVAARASTSERALRTVAHTCAALAGIGVDAVLLDGPAAARTLAQVADPYQPDPLVDPRSLAAPNAVITGGQPT